MDDPDQSNAAQAASLGSATPGGSTGIATVQVSSEPVTEQPPAAGGAWIVLAVSVTLALTFSFLCSIFESVLLSVSRGHVEAMAKRGSTAGKILKGWKRDDIEVPISAILILNTLAHTIGATVAGSSYESVFDASTLWLFSLLFTLAVLFFTEIIPKTLGVAFAHRLAAPVTLAVRAMVVVFKPVIFLTSKLSKALTGEGAKPVTSVEEIRLLAALGSREGVVGPRIAAFIEGVTSLRELTVHDVMVPRNGIAYLSGNRSYDDNLDIIRRSGHSRFPFTKTGDLDDVEGVVLAKELLFLDHDLPEDAEVDWEELKSPLLVVPEGKHLDEVLRLFQDQRKHLAVVVDEYGGTQGVVTLEDVMEEIVGEIEDETDRVERLITKKGGKLVCRGWAETRKLFRVLGVEKKVEAVTIGGLVADELGRVPRVGDVVEWSNIRFKVTKASRRRADEIEVTVEGRPPIESLTGSGERASSSESQS